MNANTILVDACKAALELLINQVSSADPEIVAKDDGECFGAAEIEAAKVVVQLEAALVAAGEER